MLAEHAGSSGVKRVMSARRLNSGCIVGNPYLTGLWKGCPSLSRKLNEGWYRCTKASPMVGRALDWATLKYLLRWLIVPASLTGAVWNRKDQEALAARAACWLTICSFIFCSISLGVGCAMWVATIQV